VLSNVPQMSAGQASEARRFTWLVDVLYDHRVKLLLSAAVPPDELYTAGVLAGEFQRTASRLIEMQSRAYLDAPLVNGQRVRLNVILAWQEGQITEDPNQQNNLDPICSVAPVNSNDPRLRCFRWILHP
jgi:hypothetical protein